MKLVGMRTFPRWFQNVLVVVALALAVAMVFSTRALAQDAPTLLVAPPEVQGGYAGTVLLAAPNGGGHVGIILNRPTQVLMGSLFPDHAPSKQVTEPAYFGGPVMSDTVFALVLAEKTPHKAIALAPGAWLVFEAVGVDALMDVDPNAQRYYGGVVVWRPGELAEELAKGFFVKRPLDYSKLRRPDTTHLWDELSPKKGEAGT